MNFTQSAFDSAHRMRLQRFGDKNPDTPFYVIFRNNLGSGFFSNLFHVLGHLEVARRFGLTPVVDMRHFPTLYNEEETICGTKNSWEYYFQQTSPYSLEEVYQSKNVFFCDGQFIDSIYDHTLATSLVEQYVKANDSIISAVEEFCEKFTGKKILGVHFRGQEMNSMPGHPKGPTIAQMLDRARSLIKLYPVDLLFVVTEEQKYLDAFTGEFGDRVVFTDAFRTYDVNAYRIRPYPRPQHMYRLGLDILKEALILARADYFLAGGENEIASGSNVSRMAQIFNGGRYEHVELIYNGSSLPSLGSRYPLLYRIKRAIKYILTAKEL